MTQWQHETCYASAQWQKYKYPISSMKFLHDTSPHTRERPNVYRWSSAIHASWRIQGEANAVHEHMATAWHVRRFWQLPHRGQASSKGCHVNYIPIWIASNPGVFGPSALSVNAEAILFAIRLYHVVTMHHMYITEVSHGCSRVRQGERDDNREERKKRRQRQRRQNLRQQTPTDGGGITKPGTMSEWGFRRYVYYYSGQRWAYSRE